MIGKVVLSRTLERQVHKIVLAILVVEEEQHHAGDPSSPLARAAV